MEHFQPGFEQAYLLFCSQSSRSKENVVKVDDHGPRNKCTVGLIAVIKLFRLFLLTSA